MNIHMVNLVYKVRNVIDHITLSMTPLFTNYPEGSRIGHFELKGEIKAGPITTIR